ncbi:MAG TPA: zinc metallopeptidase [Chloroflexi bacterium]|jgi:Zn-dependent membrane protease YugP|nr:zinc metallopeptidase [Chloroflexota bacterium]
MFFPVFDPLYWLIALPALLLGLYAQFKVQSAYRRYSQVRNRRNISGYEAAQRLLEASGLYDVRVRETGGQLSDHYDPRNKVLALSRGVSSVPSVAALGIVAHEVGHAMQDEQGYVPMKIRGGLVPIVQIGSWLGPIIFIAGLFLPVPNLSLVGLLLFSGTFIFSLVTLPVEMDASRRAVALLERSGLLVGDESHGVRSVLSAASLTYVAAAVQSLSTILYYLLILSGGRRRRF